MAVTNSVYFNLWKPQFLSKLESVSQQSQFKMEVGLGVVIHRYKFHYGGFRL